MPGVIGQPPQYVAVSGQVNPVHLQSQAFQVPSAQPLEVSAGTAVASTPAYSAAAAASASTYTGATTEPPPYQEKF
jgi:hypothetical protein